MTDESTIAYLAEVLALDPSEDSGRIMELRAERAASVDADATRGAADTVASGDLREEALAIIQSARADFWSETASVIAERLDTLTLYDFPDLARMRTRLEHVGGARDEMNALENDPKADRTFTAALRRMLVEPRPEAARLRDQSTSNATLPHRCQHAKEFARLLRDGYPKLAALEADWLTRLARAHKDRKDSTAVKGALGCFGAYLMYMVLSRLIRFIVDSWQSS